MDGRDYVPRPSRLEQLALDAEVDPDWLRGHLRREIRRRLSAQAARDAHIDGIRHLVPVGPPGERERQWVEALDADVREAVLSAVELLA